MRINFLYLQRVLIALIFISTVSCANQSNAGWQDALDELKGKVEKKLEQKTGLSEKDIAAGLRQALEVGAKHAVNLLGKQDGFFKDASVKILLPESLQKVEKLMRNFGQQKAADEFVETMNRAAEQAVKTTFTIFADAIKQMSIADAKRILKGRENEATLFFREKKEPALQDMIKPIVQDATQRTGVTKSYKKFSKKASRFGGSVEKYLPNIDEYVTQKALDGLFKKIAIEEAKIRKDPAARTTELLKKVFARSD